MTHADYPSPECMDKSGPTLVHARFPSTIQLLTQGGDARISPSGNPLRNKYGCSPFPDPGLISFGSSTASVISEPAFLAANNLRDRLMLAVEVESPEVVYRRELTRIRHELLALCELDDVAGLEVVFGASGTDLHLIAVQLANGIKTMPTLVIMPEPSETGSGVGAALASKHFSSCSALGGAVTQGAPIEKTSAVHLVSVPIRFDNGELRPEATVDAEIESLVSQAAKINQKVLLVLVDTSKTGLISPSIPCAIKLKQRYPQIVDVLVDACQFRISTAVLRAYLEHGFMVIVTGSKFITGPVFSGALFIPESVTKKLLSNPIPAGLCAYSSQAEWSVNCTAAKVLDNVANFGLLLRWQAAIEELRQFKSVPDKELVNFTRRFANAIQDRLLHAGNFSHIPTRKIDRYPLVKNNHWDEVPTIFSFVLFRNAMDGKKEPLSDQETMQIYHWLQLDPFDPQRPEINTLDASKVEAVRCLLGQPVFYGKRSNHNLSALRLCLSARLIVEATADGGKNADQVIQRALSVLDNVRQLLKLLPPINDAAGQDKV